MDKLRKLAIGACLGAGALTFTAVAASAAIVCNEDGDCWHAGVRHEYPAAAGVIIQEDNWAPTERHRWREHEGRGYWRGGNWVEW
jgi:hypothetical protein